MSDLPTAAVNAGAQVLQAQGWLREGSGVLEAQRAAEVAIRAALPLLYPAVEDPELSEVERRAMRADLHGGTCKTPLVACSYCIAKLGEVRQVVRAAGPVIEREAREDERAKARAADARYAAVAGRPESDEWKRDLDAVLAEWQTPSEPAVVAAEGRSE